MAKQDISKIELLKRIEALEQEVTALTQSLALHQHSINDETVAHIVEMVKAAIIASIEQGIAQSQHIPEEVAV